MFFMGEIFIYEFSPRMRCHLDVHQREIQSALPRNSFPMERLASWKRNYVIKNCSRQDAGGSVDVSQEFKLRKINVLSRKMARAAYGVFAQRVSLLFVIAIMMVHFNSRCRVEGSF
ncbi:hypothetical protein D7I41_06175 [Ochrobactrum sp. MH181795]|nr:hypothetical protein D7I41_06175 [Ochrobactrum sp. MH181795]